MKEWKDSRKKRTEDERKETVTNDKGGRSNEPP
jgi:hypothetical protein